MCDQPNPAPVAIDGHTYETQTMTNDHTVGGSAPNETAEGNAHLFNPERREATPPFVGTRLTFYVGVAPDLGGEDSVRRVRDILRSIGAHPVFTVRRNLGAWTDQTGDLIEESIEVVLVIPEDAPIHHDLDPRQVAEDLADEFGQDEVMVTVERATVFSAYGMRV